MFLPSVIQTQLLVWGVVAHIVADWLLQTEWMALNKRDLRHAAAWVHSGIHFLLMLLIFPWFVALFVATTHLLIDTRVPLRWWMVVVKRIPPTSPATATLEIWMDQVLHVTVMAFTVLIFF